MKSEKQSSQSKAALRTFAKAQRNLIDNKEKLSKEICNNFLMSDEYKSCKTLLCYIAFNGEVDTSFIISRALSDGKTVGVPVCLDKNGKMEFYKIDSFDDLHNGTFGISEPDVAEEKRIVDFEDCIIVVPALCFDEFGNRLGYGRGYYDRYLQNHSLISFGLCYNMLIIDYVVNDAYDKRVDFVVSEKRIITCNGGQNG